MKNFKKYLATSAIAALVATAVAPVASASVTKADLDLGLNFDHPFTDVSKNYEEAVGFLYFAEIVNGKTEDTYGTNQNLTRGDAAVILANALGLDTENAPDAGFTDLIPRIAGSVNALADAGIISGIDEDTFAPNEPLSRGAMAKFLALGFELEEYAEDAPYSDAVGVFEPFIDSLYGADITKGKTATSYGTHLNITRGEFANLLYKSIMFVYDNMYVAYAESVTINDSTSFTLELTEAAPEEYTAKDIWDFFYVDFVLVDDSSVSVNPSSLSLSADRKTLTVEHTTYDFAGKEGYIIVDDELIAEFDYVSPVAGEGSVTLEGVDTPITFDFAGTTEADVSLPVGTTGVANLNALELTVEDNFTEGDEVTVILKDTDVAGAQAGIDKAWGTLTFTEGTWALEDNAVYNTIPAGTYVLEAPFTDAFDNTTTLTLNVTVE